ESEIDAAFASLVQLQAGALLVAADPFFFGRREQLVALASRHAVPVIYGWREAVAAGGLVSYGPSFPAVFREIGIYTGRILKGAKPADLPVQQPTKSSWWSISRLPRPSASPCRDRCSRSPTRSSNRRYLWPNASSA